MKQTRFCPICAFPVRGPQGRVKAGFKRHFERCKAASKQERDYFLKYGRWPEKKKVGSD